MWLVLTPCQRTREKLTGHYWKEESLVDSFAEKMKPAPMEMPHSMGFLSDESGTRIQGVDSVERAARIVADRLGWDEARVEREISAYREYIRRFEVAGREYAGSTSRSVGLDRDEEGLEP